VIHSAELPTVRQVNGNHFAGHQPGGNESPSNPLDQSRVLGVSDAAVARAVDDGGLVGVAGAGFEDDVVDEAALRVGVETGAKHAQVILARRQEVFHTAVLAAEFAEEVGFFHAVFEGFAAVDEDYGDFIGELAAELFVAVYVDVLPGEAAAAVQFGQALFDDFAEMAAFAGVDDDLAEFGHWAEFNKGGWIYSSDCKLRLPYSRGGCPHVTCCARYNSHLCVRHRANCLRGRLS